jgi:CRISPR-associated protein Csh1
MINDLIELFGKAYQQYGDKLILDSYKPDEGLYIRINEAGEWESLIIRKKELYQGELYDWFKVADYNSCLVVMNKPVDPKKTIHSNNYMTMFIKKDYLPIEGKSNRKLTEKSLLESINRYFDVFLKKPKDRFNIKSLKLLESIKLEDVATDIVKENKKYLTENIQKLLKSASDAKLGKNDYVKVFFYASPEAYQKENKHYLIPKLFNTNEFNISINEKTYGLSNINMGLNAKKPYLELMSTNFKVAFRVDLESALLGKKFFDWLSAQKINSLYIPYKHDNYKCEIKALEYPEEIFPHFYLHKTKEETGITIDDFDYLPDFLDNIEFILYNYLMLEEGEKGLKVISDDKEIKKLYELEDEVNEYLFCRRLKNSYYQGQEPNIKSGEFTGKMLNVLIQSRKALHDYFKKGIETGVKSILDHSTMELIKAQVGLSKGTAFTNASKALNLRLSLLKYFNLGGGKMGDKIRNIYNELNQRLSSEELVVCENEDEFFFLSGQVAFYLLDQSESKSKTHGMAEPFLRIKNSEQLKKQFDFVYKKYGHAIPLNFEKFNNAMSAVKGFEVSLQSKINEDLFLAGFLAKNMFYIKKTKED